MYIIIYTLKCLYTYINIFFRRNRVAYSSGIKEKWVIFCAQSYLSNTKLKYAFEISSILNYHKIYYISIFMYVKIDLILTYIKYMYKLMLVCR